MRDVPIARFLSVTLVALLWISSVASLYQSPYMLKPNDQVTQQMILSVGWLHEHRPSYAIDVAPFSMYNVQDMYKSVAGVGQYEREYVNLAILPDHLAYGNTAEIRGFYGNATVGPIYVVYDRSIVQIYEKLYPHLLRYTQKDVGRFLSNPPVLKTYDNADSQVWVILGT
jgi:hypothetical protein